MDCFMGLSGLLGVMLIISIRMIANKVDRINVLKNKIAKLEYELKHNPPINKDIVFDSEGGYKVVER